MYRASETPLPRTTALFRRFLQVLLLALDIRASGSNKIQVLYNSLTALSRAINQAIVVSMPYQPCVTCPVPPIAIKQLVFEPFLAY